MSKFNIDEFSENLNSHKDAEIATLNMLEQKQREIFQPLLEYLHDSVSPEIIEMVNDYVSFSYDYNLTEGSKDYGKWCIILALKEAYAWEINMTKWKLSNREKIHHPKQVIFINSELVNPEFFKILAKDWESVLRVYSSGKISFYEKNLPPVSVLK